jgi:YbbR domain-containing protein
VKRLLTAVVRHWPWKLLSLALAAVLWLAIASEPEMATVLRVPVQYKNAPRNLEISSHVDDTVRLELMGLSGRLRSFAAAPSPVILNLAGVHAAGERTFNIDTNTVSLPRGVQLLRAVPAQLRFTFENQAQRFVPVAVRWSGSLPKGRSMVRYETDPSSLEVIGPASYVSRVRAVETDPIDLAALKNGEIVMTHPYIEEPEVRFVHFERIHVRVILKN